MKFHFIDLSRVAETKIVFPDLVDHRKVAETKEISLRRPQQSGRNQDSFTS